MFCVVQFNAIGDCFTNDRYDVKTKTEQWGHENSWTIGCHDGSCRECVSIPEKTGGYENHAEYTQECCLPEDQESFLVTCTDAFGDGWHGGYLEIDEEKYCILIDIFPSKQSGLKIHHVLNKNRKYNSHD